jgi:hypothetical protein
MTIALKMFEHFALRQYPRRTRESLWDRLRASIHLSTLRSESTGNLGTVLMA